VVSLNEVLESLAPLLTRTLGEEVDLEFYLDPEAALVEVDPGQLQQVLLNLVVNARQAMPAEQGDGGDGQRAARSEVLSEPSGQLPDPMSCWP